MKTLKIYLVLAYVLVIVLLLLSLINCNDNATRQMSSPATGDSVTSTDELADTTAVVDTTETVRQAEDIGNKGDLKVTLLWDFPGDIDVHVIEPNNYEIYYDQKRDERTGGELDVDNRDGGQGSAENIYWIKPPKGQYKVRLVYYQASRQNGEEGRGTCRVVIFQKGKQQEIYNVPMSHASEVKNVTTITVN